MIRLFAKVNYLLAFCRVAISAKRLEVFRVIGATYAEWDDVIHRWWALSATGKAAAVRGVSVKDGNPFITGARTLGITATSEIAMFRNAVRFRVSGTVIPDDLIPPLAVFLAPFCFLEVQSLAILGRPSALTFKDFFLVCLAILSVRLPFSLGVSLGVFALICRSAFATLRLFAVRVSLVWGKVVQGFEALALRARLEDNRHRSISLLDWAMPRLLQQRVAFSFPSLYLWWGE